MGHQGMGSAFARAATSPARLWRDLTGLCPPSACRRPVRQSRLCLHGGPGAPAKPPTPITPFRNLDT